MNDDTTTIRYNKAWLAIQILIVFFLGCLIAIRLITSTTATYGVGRLGDVEFWASVICMALCAFTIWQKGRTLLKSNASITLDYHTIQLRNGASFDLSIDWHDVKEIKPIFIRSIFGNFFTTIDIHLKQQKKGTYGILNASRRERVASMAFTPFRLFPDQVGIVPDNLTISADELYQCFQRHVDIFNKLQSSVQSNAYGNKLSETPLTHNDVETQPDNDDTLSAIEIVKLPEQCLYRFVELPYRLAFSIDVVLALILMFGFTLMVINTGGDIKPLASPAASQLSGFVSFALVSLFILQTVNAWPAQINRRSRNAVHRLLFKAHGLSRFGWFGVLLHMFVVSMFLGLSIDQIFQYVLPAVA